MIRLDNPITQPFKHYWIENVFEPEQYSRIVEFSRSKNYEEVGDSCRGSTGLGHSNFGGCELPFVMPDNIVQTLTDAFWNSIIYQYPKATKEIVYEQAHVESFCVRDRQGYEMPPHQDGGSFIVGYAQLFIADETDDHHGIILHRSLQPERKMNIANAVDPDKQGDEYDAFYKDHTTEAVITYPYKANCLYAIGCDDTTWHEVKSVKPDFNRYSLIWQLYWNQRGDYI